MFDKNTPAAGPKCVNDDERYEQGGCDATVEHLGAVYGCCYGGGHDAGRYASDHGASVRDDYGHVSHDLVWATGESVPRVHPGEWWSNEAEQRVRADGCRIARTVYQ